MKFCVSILLLALFSNLPFAGAETVTLTSTADAELRESHPEDNFGNMETAVSGKLGVNVFGEIRRAVFQFDVSSIPPQATVTSATLSLTVTMVPSPQADSNFALRRLLQPWTETDVSWNNRLSGASWSTAGATGDIAPAASSSVFIADAGAYVFPSTANLVADIQGWVTNATSNFGWLLISDDEVNYRTARHFGARENLEAARRPVLTVQYTLPANPPVISNLSHSGGQIQFAFDAEANRPYTVETRASLSATNWNSLTNFTASPTPVSHTVMDEISETTRFYRVRTP